MSELSDFQYKFKNSWFSAGWVEVAAEKQTDSHSLHKDLATLQAELEEINQTIENIAQKQLRLANLAKLYN